MSALASEQIVTSSLRKHGATCVLNTDRYGNTIVVATWKSTVWRILDIVIIRENEINNPIPRETRKFQDDTISIGQTSVIAWVFPDGVIKYHTTGAGKIIRPRCLCKPRGIK